MNEDKIFNIKEESESTVSFHIELPTGKTMEQINNEAKKEIQQIITDGKVFGKYVRIEGRITTGLSMLIGHEFSHVCHQIELFDPKENNYFVVVKH